PVFLGPGGHLPVDDLATAAGAGNARAGRTVALSDRLSARRGENDVGDRLAARIQRQQHRLVAKLVARKTQGGTPATVMLTRLGVPYTLHAYRHDPRSQTSYG